MQNNPVHLEDNIQTNLESDLALELLRVVEAAAIASAREMGTGDRKKADQVATETMRRVMDTVPMRGTIVIGEGERDEAPMLYIGEKVGRAPKDRRRLPGSGYCSRSAGRHQPLRHRRAGPICVLAAASAVDYCTRRTATWKKSWSARPARARWIWMPRRRSISG